MEKRICNLIIQSPGGTAGIGSSTYKVSLPTSWVKEMGLGREDRQVELIYDGNCIRITRRLRIDGFLNKRIEEDHQILMLSYFDGEKLCSKIAADYSDKTVCVENFTDDVVKMAFGNNEFPGWTDYKEFLESRCVPRARAGLRHYLNTLGLEEYDPLEIIRKTAGKMAEDQQWIQIEVVT